MYQLTEADKGEGVHVAGDLGTILKKMLLPFRGSFSGSFSCKKFP